MTTSPMTLPVVDHRRISIEGVISLLLTPLKEDKTIHWHAYDAYVDWQLAKKPAGLFAVCGSSEMKWLEPDERIDLARRAVERADDVPVLATANLGDDPGGHADEIHRMVETGVSGVVLVPPANVDRSLTAYRAYIMELVDTAGCPVFLYEWPQVLDYFFTDELIGEVGPYVSGIKDTTCTIEGISQKIEAAAGTIVYQANIPFLVDSFEAGARGTMAVTSTCYAELLIELWERLDQDDPGTRRLHRELVTLDSLLRFSYPATAKYVASKRGAPISVATRWPGEMARETAKALDVWLTAVEGDRES